MKRFYTDADTVPDAHGGHAITLDGRTVKTPARRPLVVPTCALADAIVAEWRAQGETIDPASMPMTGLANAAIDHADGDRAAFTAPLAAYAASDLFCYRDDRDGLLASRQAAAWNPHLAAAEARYGIEFAITAGIVPVDQPPATIARLAAALDALGPFQLAAMAPLVTIGGSLVAALAVADEPARAAAIWSDVMLDELYQEERWGRDEQATQARDRRQRDWDNAARFVTLLA
jgi:chaperone required for assembly of F1-ATPase